MTDDESGTGEKSMAGRTAGSRVKLWLLVEADRYAIAGVVLAASFAAVVAASLVAPTSLETMLAESDPVETTFQAFVGSVITGVTLVVTITQLVISQEQGPLGDQRQRMEGAMSFREDVETVLDAPVSPPDPASFLGSILGGTREYADELAEDVDQIADADVRESVERYAAGVAADASRVGDQLENTQFGTFDVVSAALDFDYSGRIYDGRSLRRRHAEALPETVDETFEELLRALTFYGPAREHVKTLYFQWELINLSRDILYAAVPALLVSVAMILFADGPSVVAGTSLGVSNVVWLVATAVTVALTPFVVLLSYVLRIGTVAKRTLAIGPIILRETGRSGRDDRA